MSQNQDPNRIKKQKPKKNRKKDWSFYVIIVSLIILAIPTIWIAWESISANMKGGSPIVGERFEGDLEPAITEDDLKTLTTNLESLEGVEATEVVVKTATLRIFLKVPEDTSAETIKELTQKAYDTLTEQLPVATYFTTEGERQMYDIEISVFNLYKTDEANKSSFIYYMLNKSSIVENPTTQELSAPVSSELVEKLKGNQSNETDETENSTEEETNEE